MEDNVTIIYNTHDLDIDKLFVSVTSIIKKLSCSFINFIVLYNNIKIDKFDILKEYIDFNKCEINFFEYMGEKHLNNLLKFIKHNVKIINDIFIIINEDIIVNKNFYDYYVKFIETGINILIENDNILLINMKSYDEEAKNNLINQSKSNSVVRCENGEIDSESTIFLDYTICNSMNLGSIYHPINLFLNDDFNLYTSNSNINSTIHEYHKIWWEYAKNTPIYERLFYNLNCNIKILKPILQKTLIEIKRNEKIESKYALLKEKIEIYKYKNTINKTWINTLKPKIKIALLGSCFSKLMFNGSDFFIDGYDDFCELVYHQFHHSLVSMMSLPIPDEEWIRLGISNNDKNKVEIKCWAKTEFDKSFLNKLLNSKSDYLIIDNYADACCSLYQLGENKFITRNYFMESTSLETDKSVIKIIEPSSEKRFELFCKSADEFIDKIKKIMPLNKVILIEARLSKYLRKKDGISKWNIPWIDKFNINWEKCDEYIKKIAPEIRIINMRDLKYISASVFPLNLSPSHYEKEWYREQFQKLNHILVMDMLNENGLIRKGENPHYTNLNIEKIKIIGKNHVVNSYFKSPYNSKGKNIYYGEKNGVETIDDWFLFSNENIAKLILKDEYIEIQKNVLDQSPIFMTEINRKVLGNKISISISGVFYTDSYFRITLRKGNKKDFVNGEDFNSKVVKNTDGYCKTIKFENISLKDVNSESIFFYIQLFRTEKIPAKVKLFNIQIEEGNLCTDFTKSIVNKKINVSVTDSLKEEYYEVIPDKNHYEFKIKNNFYSKIKCISIFNKENIKIETI